jgi:hypothetical protein
MSDWPHIIQTAISGVVSGGAGAATTLLAFFKEQRARIEKLEKAVGTAGSSVEPRTGMFLVLSQLDDQFKSFLETHRKFKREIEGWEDDPPDWLTRALNRRTSSTSISSDHFEDFEARIDLRVKTATERLKRLEEAFDQISAQVSLLPEKFEKQVGDKFVDAESYEQESKKRAEEVRRIQENLHTANGFLRGVMAALGYLDPPSSSPQTPQVTPPRKK